LILFWGLAMPKAYSGDLRERVIESCGDRRVATRGRRTFRGERELGDKVAAELARQKGRHAQAARREHFSVGAVRGRGLALIANSRT